LAENGLTDDRLIQSLSVLPERSIVLLEDIDAVFAKRDEQNRYGSQVTFSGLLNTLDGVVSTEQRLVFMTTNHKERLDPALIRPGRVDVSVYIGDATANQAKRLFLRFYESEMERANRIEKIVEESSKSISMASLQGHFLLYKSDAKLAVEKLESLLNNHNENTHKS
jgi:mitochondrial chaperone BCS1